VNARKLTEHIQTTAPGDAKVLVHLPEGLELQVETARVETREGHFGAVVIVYLKTD
jgi:hypothetical protein